MNIRMNAPQLGNSSAVDMMAAKLAGKHAVVVGATGVIGSHIARTFAAHGAVVSLLGRTALQARPHLEPQLDPYRGPSAPDTPASHRFIPLDVTDTPSIKEVFADRGSKVFPATPSPFAAAVFVWLFVFGSPAAPGLTFGAGSGLGRRCLGFLPLQDVDAVGPLDLLVNCAGISQTTLLKRTPDEGLASIVDTNLLATMLACKHARIRQHGCIINVASLMATKAGLGVTAYAASKAGVVGFTRALCREMAARSIRVNALLPGWVQSPMWNHLKPELQEAYLKDTPLNRVARPTEVADAALFLASNEFANNCVLNLDGGLSAA